VDEDEIRKSAALEDKHWWYAGRRALIRRKVRHLAPGRALDVGAGSGGNTAVLRDLGWDVAALEYSPAAAELCAGRGIPTVRADARRLPFPDEHFDLVMSTDLWEHVDDDKTVAAEAFRVLRPGGALLLAVPSGMDLWSGHDVALGHVRRYERQELVDLVTGAGFQLVDVGGWNVLLRPVARMRRRRRVTSESEMEHVNPVVNAGLRVAVGLESVLPVERFRGVSLVLQALKPAP
jgi:SAM-dependent methyltransferase